jgi:hypothetical protein
LSEGETEKVKPVIQQSLLETTLKRATEIDSVFSSKSWFVKSVKTTAEKAYKITNVKGFEALADFWENLKIKKNKKFSLFEEFNVKSLKPW